MINVIIRSNTTQGNKITNENTTLRQVLEDAGIDYTIGMTSLDGSTLRPGDLDKTFADFGVTEKCYLMSVVKADNAAAIKIVGSVAVIESSADLETIEKVAKYRPNALKLFEGTGKDKETVFAVDAGRGLGSINKYGVSFGAATTVDGKATVTIMIPEGTEDAKEYVKEKVGVAILNLNKVEQQFAGAVSEIDTELANIEANIRVM